MRAPLPHLPALAITITALLLAVSSLPAMASAVIVPDDFTTIQAAIDSGADTVRVREGTYPERPLVDHPVILEGIGTGRRPLLDGLDVVNDRFFVSPRLVSIDRLDFAGRIDINTAHPRNQSITLRFSDCMLGLGMQHGFSWAPDDIDTLSIQRCRMSGYFEGRANNFYMQADTVDGEVAWDSHYKLGIVDSWFRGGTPWALHVRGDNLQGTIANNRIENYERGITGQDMDGLVIQRNAIVGCGIGMFLRGGFFNPMTVHNNEIMDCGTGLIASADDIAFLDNIIMRSAGPGMQLERAYEELVVERNIVGECGGPGIVIRSGDRGASLRNNTVFNNGGHGVEVVAPFRGAITVQNNIGFGNTGWGLLTEEPVDLGCNNWFGNGSGAVSGPSVGSTDLSIDPQFCNVDGADVRLMATSPLLDALGCGLIGALGLGCGATPILVALLRSETTADGIRIEWQWGGLERPASFWIDRAEDASGPWVRIVTDRHEVDGIAVDLDRQIEAGHSYFYRLAWVAENGERGWSEPITATVFEPASCALESITPNPSNGPVEIAWSLPSAGNVDIAIFDIAGREVARLASGAFAAGSHRTMWNGRILGGSTAPGLYFVRLRHEGREMTRRILLRR